MAMGRHSSLKIHRWTGLIVVLALVLQTSTGIMLVYRWQLAQWLDPAGMVRTPLSTEVGAGAVYDAVRKQLPGLEIQRIYFPQTATGTYFVKMRGSDGSLHYASIDPGTAAVLRSGSVWRFPVEAALQLHYQPVAGKPGTIYIILVGAGLLALLVSGVWFWWPRAGRWRNALVIHSRAPVRVKIRQIHRAVAICLAPIVLVMAVTGLLMALEILIESSAPTPAIEIAGALDGQQVDNAIALAQEQFPEAKVRDIGIGYNHSLAVKFHAPERNSRALHLAVVDAESLSLVSVNPADSDRSWWVLLLPIHSGDAFAAPGRWLVLLTGAGLLLISILGACLWYLRVRR